MCTAFPAEMAPARSRQRTPAAAPVWYRAAWCRVVLCPELPLRWCLGGSYQPARPRQTPTRRTTRSRANCRESSASAFEQELGEEPDADRRWTFGVTRAFAFEIGGSGDVEVHPRKAVHELAQEPRAGNRAGRTAAGVLDVGDVGLEQLPIIVPQRQRPAALAGTLPGIAYLGKQCLIVAHHPDRVMAERDDDGTRQRCGVDCGGRLEASRVRQRVAENQTSLGVRVDDLDRFAEVTLYDVTGFDRRAGGKVFGGGDQTYHVDLRLQTSQHFECAEHRGRTRLIELHVLHVGGGLDRDATRIERHPFADQYHRGARAALILEYDKAGLLRASLRDREQRPHPFLLYLCEIEDRHAELVGRGELASLLAQERGRADVAGLHLEIAREEVAGSHGVADAPAGFGCFLVGLVDDDVDGFEVRLGILGLFLELGELPASLCGAFDRDLHDLGDAE